MGLKTEELAKALSAAAKEAVNLSVSKEDLAKALVECHKEGVRKNER